MHCTTTSCILVGLILFLIPTVVLCSDDGTLSAADIETLIALHNNARREAVPVPITALAPLTWDNIIANSAQLFVNKCSKSYEPKLDDGSLYGENSFISDSNNVTTAFNNWMDQQSNFDFTTAKCFGETCRNYLQIVSEKSIIFGCASAECPFGVQLVCNYRKYAQYLDVLPYKPLLTKPKSDPRATTTAKAATTKAATTTTTKAATTSTTGKAATTDTSARTGGGSGSTLGTSGNTTTTSRLGTELAIGIAASVGTVAAAAVFGVAAFKIKYKREN